MELGLFTEQLQSKFYLRLSYTIFKTKSLIFVDSQMRIRAILHSKKRHIFESGKIIFLQQLPLSTFLPKTLTVNKKLPRKVSPKSIVRSLLKN